VNVARATACAVVVAVGQFAAAADAAGTCTAQPLPRSIAPGQLVVSRTSPDTVVDVAGQRVRVGSDGVFVFGVGRDADAPIEVRLLCAGTSAVETVAVTRRDYRIERVDGLPQHTVTPDPDVARRIAEEQARVARARERDDARDDFSRGFEPPARGRVSGVYGSQRIDNGVAKSPHLGLDVAVPSGTPVHAPAGGIVSFVATDLVLTGGTVLIDHGHGLSSSLLHLSRIDVALGDRVERGQRIGAAGSTGRASGPHVHWGLNWFGVRLDPAMLAGIRVQDGRVD
jgi:murein DD-endopeptidase MepM/ murein hydrolase activator NlpD